MGNYLVHLSKLLMFLEFWEVPQKADATIKIMNHLDPSYINVSFFLTMASFYTETKSIWGTTKEENDCFAYILNQRQNFA